MKRSLYLLLVTCLPAFLLQACFQDMDYPEFDYPDSSAEKVYSPMKMFLTFEDDIRDKGNYGFLVMDNGNVKFTEGINGKAYQGSSDAYALAKAPSYLSDSIPELGSCTVVFWMKSTKNTSATGLFTIPNAKTYWGNFDIFLENNNSETQAFFKMHLYNNTSVKENDERWVEAKIDDVLTNEWVHMAFVYDGNQSIVTIYKNGESVLVKELPGYGKLKFKDLNTFALGAFQFSTQPLLTTGTNAKPNWASNYAGLLDQFRFYNTAVSASEIQKLYTEKE
ncbi:LamG domain-containing protein [Parabacteroides pacaensis]|uniref:LamG domain-containing protein n=1 Tax=Parabacteroides pacaensis TaxID=2086575 RepID=UPI000D104925|nr:LamG domain-containing protein [Parabacteroides pacaensis]